MNKYRTKIDVIYLDIRYCDTQSYVYKPPYAEAKRSLGLGARFLKNMHIIKFKSFSI